MENPVKSTHSARIIIYASVLIITGISFYKNGEFVNMSKNNLQHINEGTEMPPLTPEERYVIIDKETEPPNSGTYNHFHKQGIYIRRQCRVPLFRSDNKFNSGCDWPAFDKEISGAVRRLPDPDGIRTEIVCAKCGAHLGHVFTGENSTPANTRHCVNSNSLKSMTEEKSD